MLAGSLSDKRIQLFESKTNELWTCWKENTDPDASWTAWSQFTPDVLSLGYLSFSLGAAAQLSNGELQLFVRATQPLEVNVLGGPEVETTWKVSPDNNSAWADWQGFYKATYGPPGSPMTGILAITAGPLGDGRLQVFMQEDYTGQFLTRWQNTTNPSAGWSDSQPFNPQPPPGVSLGSLATASLPDGRLQIWGVDGFGRIWSTWKTGDSNSSWSGWTQFQALPSGGNPGLGLNAAQLPDGRVQLFAVAKGNILSCWKTDTNPNAGWTEWQPFFGSNIPIFGSDVNAVTVAPLSDGRLQLWGNITNGALFTTWKETIDPNAAWSPWSPFPTP